MSLRVAHESNWRGRFSHQLYWRRIARYHLGMELLRAWKQLGDALTDSGLPDVIDSLHRFAGRHHLHRRFRFVGGWEAMITLTVAIGASVTLFPTHSKPVTANTSAAVALATPAFTDRIALDLPPSQPPAELATKPSASALVSTDGVASKLKRDYAFARERCMARLRESDSFQKAQQEADELQAEVESLRREDPRRQLPDVSLSWMRAKSRVNGMIQTALKSDAEVQKAESAMRAGGLIQPTFPIRSQESVDSSAPTNPQAAAAD